MENHLRVLQQKTFFSAKLKIKIAYVFMLVYTTIQSSSLMQSAVFHYATANWYGMVMFIFGLTKIFVQLKSGDDSSSLEPQALTWPLCKFQLQHFLFLLFWFLYSFANLEMFMHQLDWARPSVLLMSCPRALRGHGATG